MATCEQKCMYEGGVLLAHRHACTHGTETGGVGNLAWHPTCRHGVGGRPAGRARTAHALAAACWTEISLAPVKDRGDGVCNPCTTSPLFKQSQLFHSVDSDPGFSLRRHREQMINVCRFGCKCTCV